MLRLCGKEPLSIAGADSGLYGPDTTVQLSVFIHCQTAAECGWMTIAERLCGVFPSSHSSQVSPVLILPAEHVESVLALEGK